jgi:general secretion pathway protein E
MARVSLQAEGLRWGGRLRPRVVYYEELRAVRAVDGRLSLDLHDGRVLRVKTPDAETLAAAVHAVIAPLEVAPATLEALRAALSTWAASAGFTAAPVVDGLLRGAAALGASDLHIQPDASGAHLISLRLDGALHPVSALPAERGRRVVARFKVLAGLQSHRQDIPQEGRAPLDEGWVRLGLTPAVGGEALTVRLFDRLKGEATLGELGFDPDTLAAFRGLLAEPHGVVLLAGSSASGKTTTLYTALRHLLAEAGGTLRALTVEDPVEFALAGVTQLEADPARGLDGDALLRSALRQDADVLVVGEVRSAETAALLLRAGLTGHRVLGTIHAGSAEEAILRLREQGVPEALLGAALRGVLYQRLLRRRCCPAGCADCHGTGYRGRFAVGEVLTQGGDAPVPALRRGRAAVAAGMTDAAELRRAFGGAAA